MFLFINWKVFLFYFCYFEPSSFDVHLPCDSAPLDYYHRRIKAKNWFLEFSYDIDGGLFGNSWWASAKNYPRTRRIWDIKNNIALEI